MKVPTYRDDGSVPTYQAQLQRPRKGQALPLTAQLSASAMAAPALAHAESGQQTARVGSEIAEFGLKRAQVGADNEAQQASAALDIELQKLQHELLLDPNMATAAKRYEEKSRTLVETYKSNMSNRLARDAFMRRASDVRARNVTAFVTENNARVVEQRTVVLDSDTAESLGYATNPANPPIMREFAVHTAQERIADAAPDLGVAEAEKRADELHYSLARDSLVRIIDSLAERDGAGAEQAIADFRAGASADPIVNAARENLSQADVDKIGKDVSSRADRIRLLAERDWAVERKETTQQMRLDLERIVDEVTVRDDLGAADGPAATDFNSRSTNMVHDAVDAHDGSDESKAQLRAELNNLRADQVIKVGDLVQAAQRERALRVLGVDTRALVAAVAEDPEQLVSSIKQLDLAIDADTSGVTTLEEKEVARQAGREVFIEAALNAHLANGDLLKARELYYSPGIAPALTTGMQKAFVKQFDDYEDAERAKRREYDVALALFEEAKGSRATSREKLRVLGYGAADGNLDPGASFRKEFAALSQRFIDVQDGYVKVALAARQGPLTRIAGDFSMVFNFMKMLDPGVVKEGEFRMIATGGGLPSAMQAHYEYLKGQKILPDNIRAQYAILAKELYDAQARKQKALEEKYIGIATRLGFDPDNVIVKFVGLGMEVIDESKAADLAERAEQQDTAINAFLKQFGAATGKDWRLGFDLRGGDGEPPEAVVGDGEPPEAGGAADEKIWRFNAAGERIN